ncbi:tail protein X [Pannonibacter sp. SL95]|uniref:tail protein X n=1 Tax=Pannonibacter sp. SL95 TaxID=2995153 RepID=UPI002273F214|nr:tail protein X [Pannonibacter sp. SL95]MCY1705468.1 tail protein X [Pannonibacter sp. SL95]
MRYTVPYGGKRLDKIARDELRTERGGTVEAILTANQGLATLLDGVTVPGGTVIEIPENYRPAVSSRRVLAWE